MVVGFSIGPQWTPLFSTGFPQVGFQGARWARVAGENASRVCFVLRGTTVVAEFRDAGLV
jgi:hypothetical protein